MSMSVQQIVELIEERMRGIPLRAQLADARHLSPTNVGEISERCRELGVAVNRIENDLNKEWHRPCDRFASRYLYERWRQRARKAAEYLRQEKTGLTRALKDARKKVDELSVGVYDAQDPYSLLEALMGLVKDVGRRQGYGYLTKEEVRLIHVVQDYFQHNLRIDMSQADPLDDGGDGWGLMEGRAS